MSSYDNYSVLSSVYYKEKPEYLRLAIDSMLNQTVVTNDYVIVKDGPLTNELDKVLDEYKKKYDCFHVVALENNSGLGAALNYGLSRCKNELVARMDTDDISMPERCEQQIELFRINEKLSIVGTAIYEFSGDENNLTSVKKMPLTTADIKKYATRRNPFNHPTVMYKKSAVLGVGGYPEGQRGEDFALFTKMIFTGAEGANIEDALLKYRADDNQYMRRSSKVDTLAVLSVMHENLKKGYINLFDFLVASSLQIIAFVLPRMLAKKLYRAIFRHEVRRECERK